MKSNSNTLSNIFSTDQRIVSLNVTSDNISIEHDLIFARPLPTEHFDCVNNIPEYINEGVYTINISEFPFSEATSKEICSSDIIISPSEMCLTLLKVYNHPTDGYLFQIWKNLDTNTIIYETGLYTIPLPDFTWDSWYSYIWSYVGHKPVEISSPGNYSCITNTSWGSATIDFQVIDTETIPKYKCENEICIRDDINGTYLDSTCDNECTDITPHDTEVIPKYKCENEICIRDDINGTYLDSTCDNECTDITPHDTNTKTLLLLAGLATLGLIVKSKPH